MKGGVVLVDPAITARNAFSNFITHCPHVQILTDTSRSSLTLHFWGCPPDQSPYRHTRVSHAFRPTTQARRVTQCIVKLVLLHPTRQQIIERPFLMSNHALDRRDFLLETAQAIAHEVNVQYGIYNHSLFPIGGAAGGAPAQCYFSPICPAIINYATNIDMPSLEWFRGMIMNKLQARVPLPRPGEDPAISARRHDRQILDELFMVAQSLMPSGGGLGIITMELMSNCTTLLNYLEQPGRTPAERQLAFDLTHLQMIRLGAMGISHADCHPNNIMVNTTVRYLPEPYPLGNAFLIDFGAVGRIQPTWDITTIMRNYQCHIDAGFAGRATNLMQAMQQYNHAQLDQARQSLAPATATVAEFIALLQERITSRLGNIAPFITGGGRADEVVFSNKKMSLDEYVDRIIDEIMIPPVKIDLRGSPKKSPLNKSRRSPTPKKSPKSPTPKKSPKSPTPKKSPKSPTPKKSPKSPTPKKSTLNEAHAYASDDNVRNQLT